MQLYYLCTLSYDYVRHIILSTKPTTCRHAINVTVTPSCEVALGEQNKTLFFWRNGVERGYLVALLKPLFNNISTLKNSELHVPTCYQCLWSGVQLKPWKNWTSKSIMKCFKEVKIDKWPDLPLIFPTDCYVRINHKPDGLFNGDIQS